MIVYTTATIQRYNKLLMQSSPESSPEPYLDDVTVTSLTVVAVMVVCICVCISVFVCVRYRTHIFICNRGRPYIAYI